MTLFDAFFLITGIAFGGWGMWVLMIERNLSWRRKVRDDADARIKRNEEMCKRDVGLAIAEIEAVKERNEERWLVIRRIYGLHGFRGGD